MHVAAQWLVGEHDFTSFRGAGCQSNTPFRRVHRIAVHRTGPLVVVDVTANAFLMHMVRNICAALWQVGCGRRPAGWLADLLAARDRRYTGPTAPPQGLYLVDVCYPEHDLPAGMAPGLLRSLGSLAVAFEGRFRSG